MQITNCFSTPLRIRSLSKGFSPCVPYNYSVNIITHDSLVHAIKLSARERKTAKRMKIIIPASDGKTYISAANHRRVYQHHNQRSPIQKIYDRIYCLAALMTCSRSRILYGAVLCIMHGNHPILVIRHRSADGVLRFHPPVWIQIKKQKCTKKKRNEQGIISSRRTVRILCVPAEYAFF